jgi:hypothetical protein
MINFGMKHSYQNNECKMFVYCFVNTKLGWGAQKQMKENQKVVWAEFLNLR